MNKQSEKMDELIDWLEKMKYIRDPDNDNIWRKSTSTGNKTITIFLESDETLFHDDFTGLNLLFSNIDHAIRVLTARKPTEAVN